MATKLDICNLALIKLGSEPITQDMLDSQSNKRAKLLALQYDTTKYDMLNDHPWNFAIKRVQLTSTGVAPAFGFNHQFSLPFDYVRALTDGEADYDETPKNWQREGDKILSNDGETIYVKYVFDVDEESMSSSFVKAFALKLAHDLCYSLVQDRGLMESLEAEFERTVSKARSLDAKEGIPKPFTDDSFINVRY